MRLWPDTLAARTISLLLGITLLMLIGSAIMLKDERRERFEERGRFHVTERLTTLVRILDVTDPDSR
ncbi:MAG: two-component sensor histidine kinase, partial [Chromatiaceae bacterium]|nr:two-component sensor histidine kinase [Chromatiaceae bacterium]